MARVAPCKSSPDFLLAWIVSAVFTGSQRIEELKFRAAPAQAVLPVTTRHGDVFARVMRGKAGREQRTHPTALVLIVFFVNSVIEITYCSRIICRKIW